jgi:hypothetical protein
MTSYNVKEGSQFSLKGFRAACKVIAEGDLPDSEANVPELVTSLRKRELELVGSEDVQSGHGHGKCSTLISALSVWIQRHLRVLFRALLNLKC